MNNTNWKPFIVFGPIACVIFFIVLSFFALTFFRSGAIGPGMMGGGWMWGMRFFWIFPLFGFAVMFSVMLVARHLICGPGGFMRSWPDSMKKGPFCFRNMVLGEGEEKPLHSSSPVRSEVQSRPARRSNTQEHRARTAIQAYLDRAQIYSEQINSLIKSTSNQKARARLQALAAQVDEWVKAIQDLAKSVGSFQQNPLIHQDLASVPLSIAKLEAQLANETDAATRIELEHTLANHRHQLAALERLQGTVNRAEIKMESTLSALGTIYSQMLTTQSTNQVADYGRISAKMDEEVRTLQDYVEALTEVKLGSV